MTNNPAQATALIGRETELAAAVNLVRSRRIVTLIGPGGIGKTRPAIEVARQLLPEFADDVWIVDLAPLTSADAVVSTIAAALNLGLDNISPDHIAVTLGSRHLLLVFDHCEGVILDAARLAETLLRINPAIHMLATSREPLLIEGEQVCRVPPLAVPAPDATNREDTLRLGAVKLFFMRLRAAQPGIVPDVRMVAIAAAICRRLDGIPLAIELAASGAAAQGVAEVAAQLDDYFKLLLGNRRTPLPRHKTLRATLDWRYGTLSATERMTLRHIAIFTGPFALDGACAVVSGDQPGISDSLHALVTASFVASETNGLRYCLLEPVRAYLLGKLHESGEHDHVARLHADYLVGRGGANARREVPFWAPTQEFRVSGKQQADRQASEGTPILIPAGNAVKLPCAWPRR